ncbi:hypothetical protein TNCV_2278811 [Trichonephila clavipes]|uniref:Uncharacterized protein n=1 Tax=Trichonephila clavipes TaxID=2585209 RepID=A0A8X6UYM2_TRICX|nr:hypothetical protein TNCV_2278811 [Trichonephila clavipes]
MQCVLWLTEFKSVRRVQRHVQTEGNVNPQISKSIHQWDRALVSNSDRRELWSPDKSIKQAINDIPFCSNTSLYTRG